MLPRLIPFLLIKNKALIKTKKFSQEVYLGDPINALRIFNEKEVDEVLVIDKNASLNGPDFDFLADLATEAFMPLGYIGGIRHVDDAKRVIQLGFEKIGFNSSVVENPELVSQLVSELGAQSIFAVVDVKKDFFGKKNAMINGGTKKSGLSPSAFAKKSVELGVGEIVVQSIDQDGCMNGYDIELIKEIVSLGSVPIVASGGAGKLEDFKAAVQAGSSAVAAGSFFVFMNGDRNSILINYPSYDVVESIFGNNL